MWCPLENSTALGRTKEILMKKHYFIILLGLGCLVLGYMFCILHTRMREFTVGREWREVGVVVTKLQNRLTNKAEIGPYVLVFNDDYDEFTLSLKNGGHIVSQLKDGTNSEIISRNYYALNNGIDFFCSLDFDRKTNDVIKSYYCLPFVDKEINADIFRYIYYDNDGDGQWDVYVDSFSEKGKVRRFERNGYNWLETTNIK